MNIQKDSRKRRLVNKRVMMAMFALLILNILVGPARSDTNLALYKAAPVSMGQGQIMTYTLYYPNLGNDTASDVVLNDTLPADVGFISASDGGVFDPVTRNVTWNVGLVNPSTGCGFFMNCSLLWDFNDSRTVNVSIPTSVPIGTVIYNTALISTTTPETRYDDNNASAQTTVTAPTLPANVSVYPNNGNSGGTTSVYFETPITFSYHSCDTATAVNITINVSGFPDTTDSMTGGPPDWTFTTTLYPRHGLATVTYTVTGCGAQPPVVFNIYIDPAGYVYDVITGARIAGATVTLQDFDVSTTSWENVPTGLAIMDPDVNPLTTDVNGQYQWFTLPGTYRVHVTAPGYNPADSIAVTVPPAVTDLNVGLTPMAIVMTTKDFRFTDVNFTATPAQLGTLLPQNGSKYNVTYVTKPNDHTVSSTNPGQLYGVVTVNGTGVQNITVADTFGTQFVVNPAHLDGGVDVLRVNTTTGIATVITDTQVTASTVSATGPVDLTINLTTPLANDEKLMIYIKFKTSLKGSLPNLNDFVNKADVVVNGSPGTASATINFV